jgi:hypothetical protein
LVHYGGNSLELLLILTNGTIYRIDAIQLVLRNDCRSSEMLQPRKKESIRIKCRRESKVHPARGEAVQFEPNVHLASLVQSKILMEAKADVVLIYHMDTALVPFIRCGIVMFYKDEITNKD